MKTEDINKVNETDVTLQRRQISRDQPTEYRWRRSDGTALSPVFTTINCALFYRESMLLLTDAEWAARDASELTFSEKDLPTDVYERA